MLPKGFDHHFFLDDYVDGDDDDDEDDHDDDDDGDDDYAAQRFQSPRLTLTSLLFLFGVKYKHEVGEDVHFVTCDDQKL